MNDPDTYSSIGDYYDVAVARAILLDPTARDDADVAQSWIAGDLRCTIDETEMLITGIEELAQAGVLRYRATMGRGQRVGEGYTRKHPGCERSYLESEIIKMVIKPTLLLTKGQCVSVRYAPRFRRLIDDLRAPP